MASGWNLWVWLQCIGVVSGCCKDLLTIIFSLLYSFFGSSIPTSLFIFKMFFRSYIYIPGTLLRVSKPSVKETVTSIYSTAQVK